MKIWQIRLIPALIVVSVCIGIFYFDKTLPIGTDVSFYLDISAFIARGQKFLVDFFDYRVPVFPLVFSPIYKLGLGDFYVRWLMFSSLYSFYALTLYSIAIFFIKSKIKSLATSLLVLVSVSSLQFDPGREISVPLFYHTVELISLFILFKLLFFGQPEKFFRKDFLLAVISGILSAIAFVGRQVHITAPLIVLASTAYIIYKHKSKVFSSNRLLCILGFCAGFGILAALMFYFFYVPGIGYTSLLKKWLLEIPPEIYRTEFIRILKKLLTTIYWGLPEMRNINLPIFWVAYVLVSASLAVNFFSEFQGNTIYKIKELYRKNKILLSFVLMTGFTAIATVFATGSGARSHESPFFTFYFFILILVISGVNFKKVLKSLRAYIFIGLLILPQSVDFVKKELKLHLTSIQNSEKSSLPEKMAGRLNDVVKNNNTVLVLGAYPTIARLVDYRPFMGQTNDIFLYSGARFFGDDYNKNLKKNLDKVDVAYKLQDYPNLKALSGLKEDETNEVYVFIEKYLKDRFEIASTIKSADSKDVIIYRRKKINAPL